MPQVNYNYNFQIKSKFDYSLKYSYQEKSKFMNVILEQSARNLKVKNRGLQMPDEIEVPKEYFNYIEKTQKKICENIFTLVKKDFRKQFEKDLVIVSAPLKKATFKKRDKITWDILLEIEGMYRV